MELPDGAVKLQVTTSSRATSIARGAPALSPRKGKPRAIQSTVLGM
ncbi:MAG: hypothetical protein M3401_19320 [Actinomycetota bacterium]|nr:hypothetical protein [Actinomycetota bacterium]